MEGWQLDVELPACPPTHLEEAYSSHYALDVDGIVGNDLVMRLHPNGLCVVALAPSHPALRQPAATGFGSSSRTAGGAAEPAAAASAAAPPVPSATNGGAEGAQQTAAQQPPAAGSPPPSGGARLVLGQRLLQAEFRKGRGPWMQLDTVLGRQAAEAAAALASTSTCHSQHALMCTATTTANATSAPPATGPPAALQAEGVRPH